MNVDEVRAILSHEFGHFSQQTMRVGTMSYRLLLVVNDMMKNTRDMLADDTGAKTLRFITESIIDRYNSVEKRNRSLSRYMEFEADSVACQLVSSRALISALCKLSPISARYDLYTQVLMHLLKEGHSVKDYLRGYRFAYAYYSADEGLAVESSDILTHPIGDEALYHSRLTILNGWNTHPSLQERIDNAHRFAASREISCTAAATLVPEEVIGRVGKKHQQHITEEILQDNWYKVESIEYDDFEQWATKSLAAHRLPHFLLRFAAETPNINTVVLDEELPLEKQPSPFTKANRDLLIEYQHAAQDWDTLNKIAAGEYDVEEMLYNNEYYTSAAQPMAIHKEYIDRLAAAAQQIGKQVYVYLLQQYEDDTDRQLFKCTCTLVWCTTEALTNMGDIYQNAHGLLEGLKHFRSQGRDVKINDEVLTDVTMDTRKFLRSLDFELLNALCGQWQVARDRTAGDFFAVWSDYVENDTPLQRGILNTVEDIWQVFTYLHNVANDRWLHALAAAYSQNDNTNK